MIPLLGGMFAGVHEDAVIKMADACNSFTRMPLNVHHHGGMRRQRASKDKLRA
jgi:hypothetical protein